MFRSLRRTLAPLGQSRILSPKVPVRPRLASFSALALIHSVQQPRRSLPFLWAAAAIAVATAEQDKSAANSLPLYTADEVALHTSAETGIWITYKDGVYDITDFVSKHPGGSVILTAAGGSVDDAWSYWRIHLGEPRAMRLLAPLRIGTLKDYEATEIDDPYASEPVRPPTQLALARSVNDLYPWSSQTTDEAMAAHLLTPNEDFFVRNHAPVPQADPATWSVSLEVGQTGANLSTTSFSLTQLKERFAEHTVTSVVQCAGNRAGQMMQNNPHITFGFAGTRFERIGSGMMGNAAWTGVRLVDVLQSLRPDLDALGPDHHVIFTSVDGYETSTPLAYILSIREDVLLAWEMNGQPLPPDHGFPLRVLIPGVAGARNVKWLSGIRISAQPSDSPWMTTWYLTQEGRQQATPLQALPMQSLILRQSVRKEPAQDQPTTLRLEGIAWGGSSGQAIATVEVSLDNGATWLPAQLNTAELPESESGRRFSWTRWSLELPLTTLSTPQDDSSSASPSSSSPSSPLQAVCRATTVGGLSQPENPHLPRGYLYNGWHKVDIKTH